MNLLKKQPLSNKLHWLTMKRKYFDVKFVTTAQLSGNMGWTNELFKVYGYVPGQKDTKVH